MQEEHQEPQESLNISNQEKITDFLPIGEYVEITKDDSGKNIKNRGIYLLPNLFTTGNLFAGFYAIISAMNGYFEAAAIAIFVAMILDCCDGRIARLTNTQSAFGAEYDSLADMVAFGLAPAILAYKWALFELGGLGLAVSFLYAACGALRLARFNVQIGTIDKNWFIGLASPAAAAVVAALVWSLHDFDIQGKNMPLFFMFLYSLLVAAVGLLMVSNIKYHSFKGLDLRNRVPFIFILVAVLAVAVIFADPPRILLLVSIAYAATGPTTFIWRRIKQEKNKTTQI